MIVKIGNFFLKDLIEKSFDLANIRGGDRLEIKDINFCLSKN